jgi:hypothetical protein
LVNTVEGYRYLSLSEPNAAKKYARVGWILLDAPPADPEAVIRALDSQRITQEDPTQQPFTVHCALHTFTKEAPRKALPETHSLPETLARDLTLAHDLATKRFEVELGAEFGGFERIRERVRKVVPHEDHDEEEGIVKETGGWGGVTEMKKLMDLCVEYFRRVYSFCFYCVVEGDSVHELQRKCYAGHFRRPPPDNPLDAKTGTPHRRSPLFSLWFEFEADFGGSFIAKNMGGEIEFVDFAPGRRYHQTWGCGPRGGAQAVHRDINKS